MDTPELLATLRDPAVWMEPSPGLQGRIVDAISQEANPVTASHRRRYAVIGVAAAVVVASSVAITVAVAPGDHSRGARYHAALVGTPLAPQAEGQVTLAQTASGWRVHLHASGLPRLDDGRYYEAWLKNGAGKLVAIGTFNEPTDVTLWAGVAPSAYPTLSVTRQVAGDGAASSGQVVLLGATHTG